MTTKAALTAGCAVSCLFLLAAPAFSQPTGPLEIEMISDATLPDHTIYRPAQHSGEALPLLVWGNGSCMIQGNRYDEFLTEIASHGYFVIAVGSILTDEEAQAIIDSQPEDPWDREPLSLESDMLAAVDWAQEQAAAADSEYGALIDSDAIALMGHSCGGLQAIGGSRDPRIDTAIGWNTGTFPEGSPPLNGADITKETLPDLRVPVAYISGDPEDIAFENADDDYAAIEAVPVFRGYPDGVGHGGTFDQPNGGEYAQLAVAWLDWHLKGDEDAATWFIGEECRLCQDENWTVSSKGF